MLLNHVRLVFVGCGDQAVPPQLLNENFPSSRANFGLKESSFGVTGLQPCNMGGLSFSGTLQCREANDLQLEQLPEVKFRLGQNSSLLGHVETEHHLGCQVELKFCVTEQSLSLYLQVRSGSLKLGLKPHKRAVMVDRPLPGPSHHFLETGEARPEALKSEFGFATRRGGVCKQERAVIRASCGCRSQSVVWE